MLLLLDGACCMLVAVVCRSPFTCETVDENHEAVADSITIHINTASGRYLSPLMITNN